ncbi:MAG TPA: hypothetical protein PKH39_19500 [Woeseiaceae bacterium]|nr:hypothetical protein [Woeseiaceae bacterium]
MKLSLFSLFPVLAIAAACGGSGAATEEVVPQTTQSAAVSSVPDDAEILNKAYDPDYDVPAGFFIDERVETTTRSFTLHHVLDESDSYERCTNDLVTAQAWEQEDNDSRAVNGYFVTSIENDRYFEFVRELDYTQDVGNIGDPTSPGYARVFKCDYADRTGVDRNLLDGYSGRLMAQPMNNDSLREFVEYLWQFRFFNVSRKAVIASYGNQGIAGPTHTLLLALVVNQGSDQCDRVDVVEWRFSFDSTRQEMHREFDTIRSFEAEMSAGSPRICNR